MQGSWCKRILVFGIMMLLFTISVSSVVNSFEEADKDSKDVKANAHHLRNATKNFRKILDSNFRCYANAHDDLLLLRKAQFFRMRDQFDKMHFDLLQRIHSQIPNPHPRKSSCSAEENEPLGDRTIYVPDDYPTIQEAVDHAQPGDTIIVRDGTYVENVVIDKPHLTIKSENGPENCIVKARSRSKSVFSIYGNHTTLTGFTIMDGWVGIWLHDSSNNIITDSIISNNDWNGIDLWHSSNNTITNNSILNNEGCGIELLGSSNNIIANNSISNNDDGIYLGDSYSNIFYLNSFMNNTEYNAWDKGKNYWDNGKIGNYWDDYFGWDLNGDGIGEIWYPIPPYDPPFNFDYHPIVKEETRPDTNPPEVSIDKPRKGYFYFLNHEVGPTLTGDTIIIGSIDIRAIVRDKESGIYSVAFYIDDEKKVEYYEPKLEYVYHWDETVFGVHKIKVVASDRVFNTNSTELQVFIVNIHFL